MELDQLSDEAREYYDSDDGGFYEATLPFFWNDRPKPDVPPHMYVDVVLPERFREAYRDELQDPESDDIIEEEVSRRLDGWLSDGRVCGVGGADGLDSVDDLREAIENDRITLIL